jgi:5'-3' exonuclease
MAKTFDEITQVDEATVLIVDGLNLAFRWKHARSFEFVDDYIKVVESLKKSYKANKVIITCDQGSSSYRKAIYPEYKQNRADKAAQQTEEEKLEFEMFFEEFNRTMDKIAEIYPVLRFNKVEADDIAAYLVKKLTNKNIWLVSSDKDWDLLVSENVSRFSYVTRKETTWENWYTHYDCEPEQYISIKCLMGDSGDNVKGVEGIGPKRAAELVKQYGSALDIVAELPIQSKYKYIQSLNANKDTIMLNYQLMDLLSFCDDAIGKDNLNTLDEFVENYFGN